MAADFLIVGHGLAGALLSWQLATAGASVVVVRDPDIPAASAVAPGIVNPLAGQRLKPCWAIDAHLPLARQTYQHLEDLSGERLWHPLRILRVLRDERQRRALEQRCEETQARPFVGEWIEPAMLGSGIEAPHGAFLTEGAARLDVPAALAAFESLWQDPPSELCGRVGLCTGNVNPRELQIDTEGVAWRNDVYGTVVFAEGWQGSHNPFLRELPWRNARGDMLTLRLTGQPFLPEGLRDCLLNYGHWLLPSGDGHYRLGATYAWSRFEAPPDPAAGLTLLAGLRKVVTHADFTLAERHCGTRPIVADRFPVLGRLPASPRLAVCNGFASKATLHAPAMTHALAENLLRDVPLPPEVDVRRMLSA